MANFATPFANSGPRRSPTSDERANGFPCGPADQALFNGLFHRIEAELGEVITFAGLTPTDAQYNQVRLAIQAMIAAATGGGEPEDYVLLNQLTSRLPFYPDMQTADGRMNITSPANGTIRIPGGITFLHRGVSPVVTVETDFNTVASRTYHLRWNPTDGFALKWTGDAGYNPTALAEDNAAFDSTYDDMLVGRIITNSSNVPTITALANKSELLTTLTKTTYETVAGSGAGGGRGPNTAPTHNINWARSPRCNWQSWDTGQATGYFVDPVANMFFDATRYTARPQVVGLYTNNSMSDQGTIDGVYRVILEA